jgi:bacteriorhodopsin
MDSNTILWITAIIMLAGGMTILVTGKRRTPSEGFHTVLHGIVPIIAACLYFAMASGQGLLALPTDTAVATGEHSVRTFYFARYIDWTFTTPLLLLSLAMTAMHSGKKRPGPIAGAIVADVIMIATAFAFGASEVGWMKWTWFIISCAAFLGVYYVIWGSQMEANALERDDIRSTYRRNATILSVLWFIYPVILAVAPDGLNIVSDAFSVLVIAILDVLAKVAYGLMAVSSDSKATDRDLAELGKPVSLHATA